MKKLLLFLFSILSISYSRAQNSFPASGDASVGAGSALKVFSGSNSQTGVKLFGKYGTWDTNYQPGYLQLYGSYIYDDGSGTLHFANGASSLSIHSKTTGSPVNIFLNSDGNSYFINALAVGRSAPLHQLHVAGDLTMNNNVDIAQFGITSASDVQKRLIIGLDNTGDGFGFIKVGHLGVTYTNLALQPNGGNVLIGTTTPAEKLTVNGAIVSSGGTSGKIIANSTYIDYCPSCSASRLFATGTDNSTLGTIKLAQGSANASMYREALTILPNGNVGLNTVTPQSSLDIRKDVSRAQGPVLELTNGGSYEGASSEIFFSTYAHPGSAPSARIKVADNGDWGGDMYFDTKGTDGNSPLYTRMYIDGASGNVLIGKTSQNNAAYKLDVAGSIRADQITVNTTGADFVFSPSYKLRSLPSVQAYINKNHHLPEIASAKEMSEEGMEVGEMNKKLLQKVEELTLYLIEKDKQLQVQQKINQQQQIDNRNQQKQINQLVKQFRQLSKK